jgi:hypothetical protein
VRPALVGSDTYLQEQLLDALALLLDQDTRLQTLQSNPAGLSAGTQRLITAILTRDSRVRAVLAGIHETLAERTGAPLPVLGDDRKAGTGGKP